MLSSPTYLTSMTAVKIVIKYFNLNYIATLNLTRVSK